MPEHFTVKATETPGGTKPQFPVSIFYDGIYTPVGEIVLPGGIHQVVEKEAVHTAFVGTDPGVSLPVSEYRIDFIIRQAVIFFIVFEFDPVKPAETVIGSDPKVSPGILINITYRT